MINVCLNYEFVPPNFLFSMAKADFSLNSELSKYIFRLCGISNIDE